MLKLSNAPSYKLSYKSQYQSLRIKPLSVKPHSVNHKKALAYLRLALVSLGLILLILSHSHTIHEVSDINTENLEILEILETLEHTETLEHSKHTETLEHLKHIKNRHYPNFTLSDLHLITSRVAYAETASIAEHTPFFSISLNSPRKNDNKSSMSTGILSILGLLSVISLSPSLLFVVTSFTRITIVLSILRNALGLQQSPPNQILAALSLCLTISIMTPTFQQVYNNAVKPLMDNSITEEAALEQILPPFYKFLQQNTGLKEITLFQDITNSKKLANIKTQQPLSNQLKSNTTPLNHASLDTATSNIDPLSNTLDGSAKSFFQILVPAFIISELKMAFQIGFLLFLPFLVIDLLISSVLMSVGMMMLPPAMISLPFKLVFFTLIDGWHLICAGLIKGYAGL